MAHNFWHISTIDRIETDYTIVFLNELYLQREIAGASSDPGRLPPRAVPFIVSHPGPASLRGQSATNSPFKTTIGKSEVTIV